MVHSKQSAQRTNESLPGMSSNVLQGIAPVCMYAFVCVHVPHLISLERHAHHLSYCLLGIHRDKLAQDSLTCSSAHLIICFRERKLTCQLVQLIHILLATARSKGIQVNLDHLNDLCDEKEGKAR